MITFFLSVFLLADPSDLLTNSLGDQLFSIVLLVCFAIWMIRRQNDEKAERQKLQDKLEKYMEEDRKQMMSVIENNTKVMERLEDHLDRKH